MRVGYVELTCDTPDCDTPPVIGRTTDEATTWAEADGWLVDDQHLCPTHRPTDPDDEDPT